MICTGPDNNIPSSCKEKYGWYLKGGKEKYRCLKCTDVKNGGVANCMLCYEDFTKCEKCYDGRSLKNNKCEQCLK